MVAGVCLIVRSAEYCVLRATSSGLGGHVGSPFRSESTPERSAPTRAGDDRGGSVLARCSAIFFAPGCPTASGEPTGNQVVLN